MQIFIECRTYQTAKRRFPWAAVIVRVEGGFMAFSTTDEYMTWQRQK